MTPQQLDRLQAILSSALTALSNAEQLKGKKQEREREAYKIRSIARSQIATVRDALYYEVHKND